MADAMAIKARQVLAQLFSSFADVTYLAINTFFKVFDSKVSDTLQYDSELWGLKHMSSIEKVQVHYCKRVLNVKTMQ